MFRNRKLEVTGNNGSDVRNCNTKASGVKAARWRPQVAGGGNCFSAEDFAAQKWCSLMWGNLFFLSVCGFGAGGEDVQASLPPLARCRSGNILRFCAFDLSLQGIEIRTDGLNARRLGERRLLSVAARLHDLGWQDGVYFSIKILPLCAALMFLLI